MYNNNVSVFPFGVKIEVFKNFARESCREEPDGLRDIKDPIIGYVGGLHKHLDFDLIVSLARDNPGWSFVFIGPAQKDVSCLKGFDNLHILSQKRHLELPRYINRFSVSIIPYMLNNYTRTVYPTKLNEYLIMGKPVVSTDLPEIAAFNEQYGDIIYVGRTQTEFSQQIKRAIEKDDAELKKKRIDVAEENSWEKRIEKMSKLIEEAIERKRLARETRWRENLIHFYRLARRRLFRLGSICLLAYFLLFKTPFIWFLAEPLKIVESPQRSDAIVVFAGGVGESGKAGQGYEERVLYSVDLYKMGFAKKLIFSSGFIYAIQEAEVMKALAVSLGIPSDDIILEKNAANTFQNIKYTKEIMKEHNWDSALVVSSPYHMRRVELVYKKIAPEIKTILTPMPNSLFYGSGKRVKMKHIKAIVHEYLGIVYYWWKGYF